MRLHSLLHLLLHGSFSPSVAVLFIVLAVMLILYFGSTTNGDP